jgi:hypothetical protein
MWMYVDVCVCFLLLVSCFRDSRNGRGGGHCFDDANDGNAVVLLLLLMVIMLSTALVIDAFIRAMLVLLFELCIIELPLLLLDMNTYPTQPPADELPQK